MPMGICMLLFVNSSIFDWIDAQWVVRGSFIAGSVVAYNWMNGVLSTYPLETASEVAIGVGMPVNRKLDNESVASYLSRSNTIYWLLVY